MKNKNNKDQKLSAGQRDNANNTDQNNIKKAHKEADKDIQDDAEFSAQSPNDDLDEAESARLGDGE